jgi:hypothetical protein
MLLVNPTPDEIIDVLPAGRSNGDEHQRKTKEKTAPAIHRPHLLLH